MANILITIIKTDTPLPKGVVFGHTNLLVTDASGGTQTLTLNGSETPPWSVTAIGLADGPGTIVATDVDSSGATIGTPVTQAFTTGAVTFPATTGISVTPA